MDKFKADAMNEILTVIAKNKLNESEHKSTRLFHGRGKKILGFEHINIDFYFPTLLVTIFKETPADILDSIFLALNDLAENILLQKRYLQRPTLEIIKGTMPTRAFANERGSKYYLNFGETQNIGFFLDMGPGREWLELVSQNKNVLNLFSYTCSLSVAALVGGASKVTNVDMSRAALSIGEANHLLNNLDIKKAHFLTYDILKSWNKISKNGPYDIVVIDPPTNQGDSFKVERDYFKIIKRLPTMTNNEALIMACLNSPHLTSKFIIDLFLEQAPEFKFQEIIYSAFSEMEKNIEEGLKIIIFKKSLDRQKID